MTSILLRRVCSLASRCIRFAGGLDLIGNRSPCERIAKLYYGTKCPEQPWYTTRLAHAADHEDVMEFMREAYFKHEPSLVNIGLSHACPAPPLMSAMCDHLRQGMTIIAEDREERIIGAAINVRSCPWEPEAAIEFASCCERGPVRDTIEFFAHVARKPNLWKKYRVFTIFECGTLAVDESCQGLGVASRLVQESWYLARDCGFRLFRIDCTSSYTAKIAEAFGWERVCTIPYCRYVRRGRQVFQHIKEPHTEVQVFVDRVRYCKTYCLPDKKCKVTSEPALSKRK